MGFGRESCLFVDEKREGNPEKVQERKIFSTSNK